MNNKEIKIFIIKPFDKSYDAKISYADDEEDARTSAQANFSPAINPRIEQNSEDLPIYVDPTLSSCNEISPKIIEIYSDSVDIEFENIKYYLTKNDADNL